MVRKVRVVKRSTTLRVGLSTSFCSFYHNQISISLQSEVVPVGLS